MQTKQQIRLLLNSAGIKPKKNFGQNFLNDASGGSQYWMLPLSMKVPHAHEIDKVEKFNYEHHIRPTSGGEFIFSRHFPDEVQGDYLYCNTIGFLGIKQYQVFEENVAIKSKWRQDLIQSSDGNCRPADLERMAAASRAVHAERFTRAHFRRRLFQAMRAAGGAPREVNALEESACV